MPNKLPKFFDNHKICIICEGNEEYEYLNRLKNLKVWNEQYDISLVNAGGNGNIPARYQDRYQNGADELVLVFCDTEKKPHEQYEDIKRKRVMHPPDNMINSLISFVNSLVYTRLLSEIYHTQLNPTISYLHEPGVRRYSLCLDISEVFKPLIGDRLIFSLLNRRQITEDSFTKELNYLHLKKEASKLIVSEFENRMKKTIMHKELGRQVSYQYLMRLEAYKLIKHLIGEKEYEGFRIWW